MSNEEVQWFYASGGSRQGPVSESVLRGLITSGVVQAQTLVWTQGMPMWRPLRETSLSAFLHAIPPPLAQAPSMVGAGESTATVAMVFSCLGLGGVFCCGAVPFAIVGVILAHVNLASAAATPVARQRSRNALVIGYCAIGVYIAFWVLLLSGLFTAFRFSCV